MESKMKISVRTGKAADGMSHGDIDYFMGDMLASLVREQAQNSGDAASSENIQQKRPVQLDFTIKNIKTADVPDIERLKEIVKKCHQLSLEGKDARENDFFAEAVKVISKPEIRVLSISDYNTTGVGGDFDNGGAFYTLALTTGVSSKENVHSGGSFGIGKMSAFAASKLRAVFYSSTFESSGQKRHYFMGRSILRSWRENDEFKDREFFWGVGNKSDEAETDPAQVPAWLRRDKVGLTTHILALQDEFGKDWESELLTTLLKNFYAAIYDGLVEFTINGGQQVLNSQNIGLIFEKIAADRSLKDDSDFDAALTFFSVLSGEHIAREFEVNGVGKFKLQVAVNNIPNLKRVQIVRNGMVITDNLRGFKDELRKFQGLKPFAAVLRPAEIRSTASAYIKGLEGPQHNLLTISYLSDEEKKDRAMRHMAALAAEVRKILKEVASTSSGVSKQLSEVDKFITSKSKNIEGASSEEEFDPVKLRAKVKSKTHERKKEGFKDGGTQGDDGPVKRTRRIKVKPGNRKVGGKDQGDFQATQVQARTLKTDNKKPTSRKIYINELPLSGEVTISLIKTARSGIEELVPVTSVDNAGAKLLSGRIFLSGEKGDALDLDLEIQEDIAALHASVSIREPKKSIFKKLRGKQ